MADGPRQPLPDLEGSEPVTASFDFFELLRRLERGGRLFGHAGRPEREPARLGQHIRLGFAVQDVADYRPDPALQTARVTVANIGLMGPEGPLPLHWTRWVLDRLSQRWFGGSDEHQTSDTTFIDFVNILQHRMMALYYRAWADTHVEVQVERKAGGGARAALRALSGVGLPGSRDGERGAFELVRVRQAAAFAQQVEGPELLTGYLSEALGLPVAMKEFVASWISVPKALQTRLGGRDARLGGGATIGPRTFQRQSRIEVRVGPLGLDHFKSMLPGSKAFEMMKAAVQDVVGGRIDVDFRIVLKRDEMPRARLGETSLGRTGWLAPRPTGPDAEDMLLRTVVGWHAAGGAAA